MRLNVKDKDNGQDNVSIHAPWEGCDNIPMLVDVWDEKFQFTHPGKGATTLPCRIDYTRAGFNSRTLGRVRLLQFLPDRAVSLVSIHAPWEGCDIKVIVLGEQELKFQFTHPGKGATCNSCQIEPSVWFQFTHPGKGATTFRGAKQPYSEFQFTHPGKGATVTLHSGRSPNSVSIHAPWEGCDKQ